MYVKIITDVEPFAPYHLSEAKHINYQWIDEDETEDILDMYSTEDYGIYSSYKKTRFILQLDDVHFFLESGVVYIMNNDGKTIDTIHISDE